MTRDERLTALLALPNDWDSYGSPPPSPKAADQLRRVLDRAEERVGARWAEPFISPGCGMLQAEWEGEDNWLVVEATGEGVAVAGPDDERPAAEDEAVEAIVAWFGAAA
ncbi:MAG: hypothetical protein Q8Q14_00605 [Gemmatimonadales bacterium]|nr:hypothetical protein [Gemmatimonadales bacterium]